MYFLIGHIKPKNRYTKRQVFILVIMLLRHNGDITNEKAFGLCKIMFLTYIQN